jgi:DNA-binding transcriptional LysR family regulator
MIDIKQYVVLAEVIKAGSMSEAARRLGLTPSAISQVITALEHRAGVKLLHRSTRKISLTEAGERCFPHCLRVVEAAAAATASLTQARDAPSGELRIAAPVGFGAYIAPALAPVLAEWPHLRLRLIVDDTMIDLVDARIDIALRVGSLSDSHWIARKLTDLEPVICAAPAYIERSGVPDAAALHQADWLASVQHFATSPQESGTAVDSLVPIFAFDVIGPAGRMVPVVVPVRTSTNNQISLQQMCEQGMGLARLFYVDVRPAMERGALVRVLPSLQMPTYPLSLLTPTRDAEPAKVRVAIAALKRYFASLPTLPATRSEAGRGP